MKSIAKNEITQPSGRKVLVSTAELPEGIYETMALLADGDELEQIRTTTRVDALQAHSELVSRISGQPVPGMYTMADWHRDGDFSAYPGQEISEEVFDEFLNVLPPLHLPRSAGCCGFMCSEPVRHDQNGALYNAFGHTGARYYYLDRKSVV